MKNILVRFVCHMLIACLSAFPFASYAGMIGTDQVAAAAQAARARDRLYQFVDRSEVRDQLQSMGVSHGAVQARVNAMTDAEVASIAGRIDRLPAGGLSITAAVVGLIVVELIWYHWVQ
jgi:hypothetical protein